jgi:ferrochelatase
MTFDAILLASFGGPEAPEEVMPFLERVTAGRGVSAERLADIAQHYFALGGVSPIQEQNRLLRSHLQAEVERRRIGLPVYWGNRNSAPFLDEALAAAHDDGHHRVLAIATSAYASYSGCRQYRENLHSALVSAGLEGEIEVAKVPPFFDRAGFHHSFADGIADALDALSREGFDSAGIQILFTTHSIPVSMALASGPDETRGDHLPGLYERQHMEVAELSIAEALARSGLPPVQWSLAFQSRSGPPRVPWLEPDINDAIRAAAADGMTVLIVVPIGFISDHVEVVWDLDREARAVADEVGLRMVRVATPGVDPRFVSTLVDLIEDALTPAVGADLGRLCSRTCCVDARSRTAAVPRA